MDISDIAGKLRLLLRPGAYWLGFAVFCVLWTGYWLPVFVTITHDKGLTATLSRQSALQPMPRYPLRSKFAVTLVNVSNSGGVVELALPVPKDQPRMKFDPTTVGNGRWQVTFGGERIQTDQPGSSITFTIDSDRISLPFQQHPYGGKVLIRACGDEFEVDLKAAQSGWHPIEVSSCRASSVATIGWWEILSGIRVHFSGNEGGQATGVIDLGWSGHLRQFSIPVGSWSDVSASAQDGWHWLRTIATALVSTLLLSGAVSFSCWLTGWTTKVLLSTNPRNPVTTFELTFLGGGVIALAANSINYAWATNAGGDYLLIALGGFWTWGLARYRSGKYAITPSRSACVSDVPIVIPLVASASAWFSLWPYFVIGPGFLGYLQTDSFFYTTVPLVLQSSSILQMVETGSVIGFGMRSIDLSTVATLSSVLQVPTGAIWIVLSLLALLAIPIASYHVVMVWLRDRRVAIVTALGTAVSAPIASLFYESYIAQFLLTAVLYFNFFAAVKFVVSVKDGRDQGWAILVFGISTALGIMLYPYFLVVPFAAFGVIVTVNWQEKGFVITRALATALVVLVAGNIGFTFLRNQDALRMYVSDLNNIAQYIVFPFIDEPKFVSFLLGTTPFHGSMELFSTLSKEAGGLSLLQLIADYISIAEQSKVINSHLDLFLLVYGLSIALSHRTLLNGAGWLAPLSIAGYGALVYIANAFSGAYALGKIAWTIACLLPIFWIPAATVLAVEGIRIDLATLTPLRLVKAGASGIAIIGLVLFFCTNAVSRLAAPTLWLANPSGAIMEKLNTPLAGDLALVSDYLSNGGARHRRYSLNVTPGRSGLDQASIVLLGHACSLLTGYGALCANCRFAPDLLGFAGVNTEAPDLSDVDLLVSFREESGEFPEGWRAVVTGERLVLLRRKN